MHPYIKYTYANPEAEGCPQEDAGKTVEGQCQQVSSQDGAYDERHDEKGVEMGRNEYHAEQSGRSCDKEDTQHDTCLYLVLIDVQQTFYTADGNDQQGCATGYQLRQRQHGIVYRRKTGKLQERFAYLFGCARVQMVAEHDPVGGEDTRQARKESAESKRAQPNHVKVNQRNEIQGLWQQETADADAEEGVEDRSSGVWRLIASEQIGKADDKQQRNPLFVRVGVQERNSPKEKKIQGCMQRGTRADERERGVQLDQKVGYQAVNGQRNEVRLFVVGNGP